MIFNIEFKSICHSLLDRIVYFTGLIAILVLIGEVGFNLSPELLKLSKTIVHTIIFIFIAQEILRWFLKPDWRFHLKNRWFENLVVIIAIISLIIPGPIVFVVRKFHPTLSFEEIAVAYLGLTQVLIFFSQLPRILRSSNIFANINMSTSTLFSISFLIPILIGMCLLKMPKASTIDLSWIDALFISTSAICVTGLSTVDVSTVFTPLGQFIIACLIKIGGLGIMTLTMAFGVLFTGSLGVRERIMMGDMLSAEKIGEVGGLLTKVLIFTLICEFSGAILLFLSQGRNFAEFNVFHFYQDLFHSVSAFNNAGFSLYKLNLYEEVVRSNYFFNSVIMALIVIGGLGYPVVSNLFDAIYVSQIKRERRILLTVQTKIILTSTAFLLLSGTFLVWISEIFQSFKEMPMFDQIFHSLFMSVTSRTAGFNTVPIEALGVTTVIIVIVLMWIGGSPMSTAGGIKNLTISIAALSIKAILTGRGRVEAFGREISDSSVLRAFVIIFTSLSLLLACSLILIVAEPQFSPLDLTFEAFSAMGTVGLSRGITSGLSDLSKTIIIVLMFIGRIGILTILTSLFFKKETFNYKLCKENVQIN